MHDAAEGMHVKRAVTPSTEEHGSGAESRSALRNAAADVIRRHDDTSPDGHAGALFRSIGSFARIKPLDADTALQAGGTASDKRITSWDAAAGTVEMTGVAAAGGKSALRRDGGGGGAGAGRVFDHLRQVLPPEVFYGDSDENHCRCCPVVVRMFGRRLAELDGS